MEEVIFTSLFQMKKQTQRNEKLPVFQIKCAVLTRALQLSLMCAACLAWASVNDNTQLPTSRILQVSFDSKAVIPGKLNILAL